MSYTKEFETVDILLRSEAETLGVDAFALSLIKAERQIRKLFTFLMYQYPVFSSSDFTSFRNTLAANNRVYFDGFVKGIDKLYPRTVKDLIGKEYDRLLASINRAIEYRNKIFHGQVTKKRLSRHDLLRFASDIRLWCETLAQEAEKEFGYDGFGRNSLRKSRKDIWKKYKVTVSSMTAYRRFIQEHMERPVRRGRSTS